MLRCVSVLRTAQFREYDLYIVELSPSVTVLLVGSRYCLIIAQSSSIYVPEYPSLSLTVYGRKQSLFYIF